MLENMTLWFEERMGPFMPLGRFILIIAGAWLLHRIVLAVIRRLEARSVIPSEVVRLLRRVASFLIIATALLMILEALGVSATVLWTAFTGFVAVAAIAFFAAWSVLSNVFCMFLIFITRPFRLYDQVELLEGGDKPGLRGEVVDVNLIYTTLREPAAEGQTGSVLQVPNSLFFQRTLRRWDRRRMRDSVPAGDG